MRASDLKNSILQLAISGKLVPQDPNDEPASILFEKIQDERKRLIAAGKIKSPKSAKTNGRINPSEPPFEIPDSWKWVLLGDIVNYSMGKTPPRNDFDNWGKDYSWVSIADLVDGEKVSTTKEKVSKKAFDSVFRGRIVPKGTLLMSFKLTIGKVSVLDIDAFHNEAIISIAPFIDTNKNMTDFLFKSLPYLTTLSNETKTAIKGNTLNSESINNLSIPLPPLAEQRRIIAKLAELEPLIARYGKAAEELARIKTAFPDDLRKAILQYAIEGKLVPQNPADEPASELLKKIEAERQRLVKEGKIKASKLPKLNEPINPADMPFAIPKSWAWCRLGNLCNFGECENVEPQDIHQDEWILDLEDIEKESGKLLTRKRKNEVGATSTKHKFVNGNVLYSKLRPYLNKVIVSDSDGYCTSEILPLNFGEHIYNRYAQMFLMSPYFVEYTNKCSYGTKMPRLGTQDGKLALFALPPFLEQKRIVEKIKELYRLIDKLAELLAQS